eukprot:3777014-Amphidinium_carterae.1
MTEDSKEGNCLELVGEGFAARFLSDDQGTTPWAETEGVGVQKREQGLHLSMGSGRVSGCNPREP